MSSDKSIGRMTIKEFKQAVRGVLESIERSGRPPTALMQEATRLDNEFIQKTIKKQENVKTPTQARKEKEFPDYEGQLLERFRRIKLDKMRRLQSFYLHGPPGIGKSDSIKQLADELGMAFKDVRLTTLDPVDLRGVPAIDLKNNIARWLPAGFLPKKEDGTNKGGILLVDEINAVPPTMQAAAYQLVLDKQVGEYVLPEGWIIIAAGNRTSDRAVTYKLPTPLANRFTHIELEVNVHDWVVWATEQKLDPFVVNFIRAGLSGVSKAMDDNDVSGVLFNFDKSAGETAFATPRSWHYTSNLQDLRDTNFPLYRSLVIGTVGKRIGSMFYNFIMHRDSLPDAEDVLTGKSYHMPEEIDTQYVLNSVLLSALERNPTVDRLDNYVTNYIQFFEKSNKKDMVAIALKDVLVRFNSDEFDNSLFNKSIEFNKILERNEQILY